MNKYLKTISLFVIILLILNVIVLLLKKTNKICNSTPETKCTDTVNPTGPVTDHTGKQYLLSHIPNFDTITLSDLPNFSDYRYVTEYNGNLIVVGYDRVIEYNPKSKEIVRTSDPKVIKNITDGIVINNHLYLVSQTPEAFSEVGEAASLYKIELNSGVIVKQFFGTQTSKADRKGNPKLSTNGHTLWLSSWSGVESIDVESDDSTNYEVEAYIDSINNSSVSKSTFVKQTYPNKTIEFTFNLPQFFTITPLVDDRRYIIASDGIYSLKNNEMPIKLSDYVFDSETQFKFSRFQYNGQSQIYYLTQDQNYFLTMFHVNPEMEIEPVSINQHLVSVLVDLKKLKIYELTKNPKFFKIIDEQTNSSIDSLKNSLFRETDSNINIYSSITNKLLFQIDTLNHQLTIGQ